MLIILTTILPVFLIIAAGYAAVKFDYLGAEVGSALNAFAVRIAVPVLLFSAIYKLDFAHAFNIPMLVSFYTGAFGVFVLGIGLARLLVTKRGGETVAIGFGSMFSNSALLGIPVALRVFGDGVMSSVYAIITLHAPLLYVVGIITMELFRRDGISLGAALVRACRSIASNSLMIGILLGIIVNLMNLNLPEAVLATIDMVAAAAIPTALIGIGAALAQYNVSQELRPVAIITVLSLIVHPAITFIVATSLFHLDDFPLQAAIIVASMPPGMNIYIFALMYKRSVSAAASAITVATVLSIFSITVWIAILHWYLGA